MKQLVFSLAAFVILLATSCNQGSRNESESGSGFRNFNPEEMADRQVERLDEAIELSKDQKKQVREIYMESTEKMMDMREEMRSGDREGMREKMQQMREEQNVKIKEILSEEQWEKYLVLEEERRSRRGQGRPGGQGGGRPQ